MNSTQTPTLRAIGRNFFRANDPGVRTLVGSIAAAVTLFAYDRLSQLARIEDSAVSLLVTFLAAIGLFNALYWFASWTLTAAANHFTSATRIRGTWHQVLYFDHKGRRRVRHGPVEIKYDASGELQLNGLNLNPGQDDMFRSTWHSLVVGLRDTRLVLVFESLSHRRQSRLGLMVFDLFVTENGGDVLIGYFSDAGLKGRHGHMRLFKQADDKRKFLERAVRDAEQDLSVHADDAQDAATHLEDS